MISISLPSPAKLNLFLHILDRREDGYHNLQTLFQLLDYGDQLSFSINKQPEINVISDLKDVKPQDNLVFKAARALQQATNCSWGCEIQLAKKIPMGAGLGGGSSNAATTLVGLNSLWQCNLSHDQLAEIGSDLGADIPVFVKGLSAFAEGIGDKLTPISLNPIWYLVVTPKIKVSTEQIFCHSELTRNAPAIKIRALSEELYRNDCQSVVETLYPEVKQVSDWLKRYGNPLMTGTGASVYCRFDSQQEAKKAQQTVPNSWSSFVAKGINQSPLHKQLENL
ncbi:MAG: 4-(cytidine 5'-diphospho)-2-C-methyl-D-erythritol kinase [Cellvibrionales bacterium TMED47]|jgi:4-diphosphocytidyl-2-C-methyl-D-erythritol kinase|nr:4-(cytidine 5'-diphospho)-2-C-methyl-D-erythritol kinase [Porticoccaceae bacterium]RPG83551.1 MAG: 4-(cytidine 5'-diphospho)-2-C-methyl-D-erythritol kinase [Cellvibrionales bacterium TMED47]|tara:strand:+ start:35732 stop:36574 length:843 start_codon:yes stop_codon:yes gene_type:complete